MTLLSVNLNKVALMRNARAGTHPGPLARPRVERAAEAVLDAGASGLTLHPRPDRRHALPEDAYALARIAHARGVELNLEGNPFSAPGESYPGFESLLLDIGPDQATLVPDASDQRTSDHGWDLARDGDRLAPIVRRLKERGCRVSLFVDPVGDSIRRAADVGADRVELYTGPYAWAAASGDAREELDRHAAASETARGLGLGVNAGHDLDLTNVGMYVQSVPGVLEVSIGQALVSDALEMGWARAVSAYVDALTGASA
ncbi:pyridoxine 5'-phosphate synthase [Rubricoccus marinus]|uniref:Pyridoxine 5'-phosphate synthase n=1 Tax=Rubricoccus marinus TaxID=716817 RepID=A0A259TYM5_9BACT|nr:pyridoxine 5'-phosphate synthase [Rubricoccus marinus]OZC02875.1 pyridoxine 5'-phosphate synthase [Rubricoccus marinus]